MLTKKDSTKAKPRNSKSTETANPIKEEIKKISSKAKATFPKATECKDCYTPHRHPHTDKKTKVTIKYDVGFNNQLYIRGKGAHLSWDKGHLLKNIKADEWVWESNEPFTQCEFKVLINDRHYETGENHHLIQGASVIYTPRF